MNISPEDLLALQALGLNHSLRAELERLDAPPDARPARITEIQRDHLRLCFAQGECSARCRPDLLRHLQQTGEALSVGDWVLASPAGAAHTANADETWVLARAAPRNRLSRRDPEGRRQALVSNVDTALLVMGLDHDYKLARLDRYLVLTRAEGVDAVVVLSKADLCGTGLARERELAVREHLAHSRGAATPVLVLNGTDAASCAQLAPWLGAGQTLVLLGSSGAGKSTLTNTLSQSASQATGGVRSDDSRGRHTTTARSLHRCGGGACIIDTPGLRGLQLDADRDALERAFDDVARLAAQCRFRNCGHGEEPGCAVREALSAGRLKSYHKLLREAGREQQGWLERREQLNEWKARGRAAHAQIRSKRGGG